MPTRRFARRNFLRLGATGAVVALTACSTDAATPTAVPAPIALTTPTAGSTAIAATPTAAAAAPSTSTASAPSATLPAPALATASPQSASKKPNIVFILTDDLDRISLSVMPKLKSLVIDAGATFTNYCDNVSLCCPSRSTFLRGQYAHNSGVPTNTPPTGGFERAYALGIEQSTVATWLQAAGYRTALMGKYLNGYPNTASPTYVPPGWTEWYSPTTNTAYGEFNYRMNENGKVVAYGNQPQDYLTDVLAGKATDFISRAGKDNAPFFLYIPTYAPHQPATPAPKYADSFAGDHAPRPPNYNEPDTSDKPAWVRGLPPLTERVQGAIDVLYRKRLASLLSVDDLISGVFDALRAAGQLDNTYVVFSSDNGFHLGNHRQPMGKQAPYEEEFRLPLMVRGPGIAAGTQIDALVGNTDYAPTFAQWAGATMPDFVDGRSWAGLLSGAPPQNWRQAYLIAHYMEMPVGLPGRVGMMPAGSPAMTPNPERRQTVIAAATALASRTAMDEPTNPDDNADEIAFGRGIPEFHGLRTAKYTYVEYRTGEKELYDLDADPYELTNTASTAPAAFLSTLATRVAAMKTAGGTAFRTAEAQSLPAKIG